MTPLVRSARELGALAAEVTDFDWRHPAWLALFAGTALFEAAARAWGPREALPSGGRSEAEPWLRLGSSRPGDLYATYLSANGGPRTDTFMARIRSAREDDPATIIAAAVLAARAAVAAVEKLAAELPDQPLDRILAWREGWLTRVPRPAGPPRVAFVCPRGAFLAELDGPDEVVAAELGAACAGRPTTLRAIDAASRAPTPAAVAIALAPEAEATARHLHRRAWTAGGGPWLGLGRTRELDLVSTCHLVVDGYGHGRLASLVFAGAENPPASLVAAAHRGLGASRPFAEAPASKDADPVGYAARLLDGPPLAFPRAAYAFGRALDRVFRDDEHRRRARFSPTFQVPLVPGDRDDAERRRRRLLFGLLALRMQEGRFEGFDDFRARLEAFLPREAAAAGLLTRVLSATASVPLPSAWRRRLLASRGEPHPLLPPVEVLAGRGSLSLIRFGAGEEPPAPLFAASAPALVDARGGCVLTLIPARGQATASICGTGRAGSPAGARRMLDVFCEELRAVDPENRR